jgi:hypothetical protein
MLRIAVIFLALAAGCSSATEHPAQAALSKSDYLALKQEFSHPAGGAVLRNKTYPVARGTPPLAYIVPADATVRIVDATDGAVVASAQAASQTLVSVDAKHGVTVAGNVVARGPIPSDHSYSIYVEPDLTSPPGAAARPAGDHQPPR